MGPTSKGRGRGKRGREGQEKGEERDRGWEEGQGEGSRGRGGRKGRRREERRGNGCLLLNGGLVTPLVVVVAGVAALTLALAVIVA